MYRVYLLLHPTGTSYVGISSDVFRRLEQHNNKTGAKFTRCFTPEWELVYYTEEMTKSEALKFEYFIKKFKGFEKRLVNIKTK
jgi:putative endonuclease